MITGHCLCGEVKYQAHKRPNWIAYCHCQSCRRATGAPVSAYAGFAKADLEFTSGRPAFFQSSPGVTRGFCGRCGTPLTYESARWPGEIHLHIGSTDDIGALAPEMHVNIDEKAPWLELFDRGQGEAGHLDGLPR